MLTIVCGIPLDSVHPRKSNPKMIDAVVPSLNTLYSQRFKGSIGYQAATKVTDQGLSGSNSYIMNLWNPNNQTHYKEV